MFFEKVLRHGQRPVLRSVTSSQAAHELAKLLVPQLNKGVTNIAPISLEHVVNKLLLEADTALCWSRRIGSPRETFVNCLDERASEAKDGLQRALCRVMVSRVSSPHGHSRDGSFCLVPEAQARTTTISSG